MNNRKIFGIDRGLIGFLPLLVCIAACNNNGKMPVDKIPNPKSLYFDYKIWGDEESGMITLNLQYRPGSNEGIPVSLVPPANVTLDGYQIEPDSSKMNGVYYELNIPVQDFAGPHEILYTDMEGRQYKERFEFPVISLKTELPKIITRKDLNFELAGLDTLDFVRTIVTDTTFYGRGIDRVDTVRNGLVTISRAALKNLRNGPVYLEFYKEEGWPLKETKSAGGRFTLTYVVKRVFELKDSVNLEGK
ncbi:hypothetical protein [Terrimonas pollutisoli]|uniref:hypothetical protein n=1 Tax=Terrimonas pollutisoli TaxID=3034147 RepID=UPI0023EC02D3|nr:hypothetical protein [Terrimonas sp. H1YJ31]